jgi:hypothetical protein
MRLQDRLATLTQEGAGLRNLKRLQQQDRGRQHITNIRDKYGTLHNDSDRIANIFASFYEALYKHGEEQSDIAATEGSESPEEVTYQDVVDAVQSERDGLVQRTGSWLTC